MRIPDDHSDISGDQDFEEDHIGFEDDKPVRVIYQDRVHQWLKESRGNKFEKERPNFWRRHHILASNESESHSEKIEWEPDSVGCFVFLPFYRTKRRTF